MSCERWRTDIPREQSRFARPPPDVCFGSALGKQSYCTFEYVTCRNNNQWKHHPPSQALRYIFTAGASPSPAALTVIHTGLAAVLLAALAAASGTTFTAKPPPCPPPQPPQTGNQQPIQRLLNWAAPSIHVAALELGLLAAVANAITVVGFANAPATHGAFLFRLSAGLTPLLAFLAGDPVSASVCVH